MTPQQYKNALRKLCLSQVKASSFLGVNERTSRRWAAEGPPEPVAKLLRVMLKFKLSPEEVK